MDMGIRQGRFKRFCRPIAWIWFCCLAAGCLHTGAGTVTVKAPPDNDLQKRLTAEKEKNKKLRLELTASRKEIESLEKGISGLKVEILAQKASAKDMAHRFESQQRRLDAAIVEVVRAKARLRSLESKAEAASTIAEAEIAVKDLKKRTPAIDASTRNEIHIADQLLQMSIEEFKASNFGGALYLANQAKGQVRALQMQLKEGTAVLLLPGEEPFSKPLSLKLLKNSNLRQGPGLNEKILTTLKRGAAVTGFSFKESWVRVETSEGLSGWLFQSLVEMP